MSVNNYERYHRISAQLKHKFRMLPKSHFFKFICTMLVKYKLIFCNSQQWLQGSDSSVGCSHTLCQLIDFVIQLSEENWRTRVVAVCNDLSLTGSQNGHQRLRLTGVCGFQWPMTALGMNSERGQLRRCIRIQWRKRGPSWVLVLLLLTDCNNRGFCEKEGWKNLKCTERRGKQEVVQDRASEKKYYFILWRIKCTVIYL